MAVYNLCASGWQLGFYARIVPPPLNTPPPGGHLIVSVNYIVIGNVDNSLELSRYVNGGWK